MNVQEVVWFTTLAILAVVALGFAYVIAQAGKAADPARAQHSSNRIRRWWFWILILSGIGIAWGTLKPFPIPVQHGSLGVQQVVEVVGHQWYWTLSKTQLTAGTPVEFRVTSADVNHGFAIYSPAGRLVTQTQAMPEYTNKLLYTFSQAGTYRVLCLEYCGLAHHAMETKFSVVAAGEGD